METLLWLNEIFIFVFVSDRWHHLKENNNSFIACNSYSAAQKLAYWSPKYGMLYEFRLRKGTMDVSSEIYYYINYSEQCNRIFMNEKTAMGVYVGNDFTETCSYIPWNFTTPTFRKSLLNTAYLYCLKSEDNYLRRFLYRTFYSIFQKEWNMFHKNLNSLWLISQYIL